MSSFDHPTLIQNISKSMATLRKSQSEAMQGFGQLAKSAMASGAVSEKHKELMALGHRYHTTLFRLHWLSCQSTASTGMHARRV